MIFHVQRLWNEAEMSLIVCLPACLSCDLSVWGELQCTPYTPAAHLGILGNVCLLQVLSVSISVGLPV